MTKKERQAKNRWERKQEKKKKGVKGDTADDTIYINDTNTYSNTIAVSGGTSFTWHALTHEESVEIASLQEKRERETHEMRINFFRSLDKDIRQSVIVFFQNTELIEKLRGMRAEISEREKQLNQHIMFLDRDIIGPIGSMMNVKYATGLTLGELVRAHLDQTLEEQMLQE